MFDGRKKECISSCFMNAGSICIQKFCKNGFEPIGHFLRNKSPQKRVFGEKMTSKFSKHKPLNSL